MFNKILEKLSKINTWIKKLLRKNFNNKWIIYNYKVAIKQVYQELILDKRLNKNRIILNMNK